MRRNDIRIDGERLIFVDESFCFYRRDVNKNFLKKGIDICYGVCYYN